jgi:DNA gyrase/topoisomerase IV subunit A
MAKELDFDKRSENNFLVYAASVIKARAISDAEDNLKPVQRRILFSMGESKINHDSKTVKCAKVVGNVMGNLHPHGDSSIYEALMRLAQPWKMRYPLIYVQGNVGNVMGDGPAAARYTECKLSEFGDLMLDGLDEGVVPYVDNYDNTSKEPTLLPSLFPNVLCNGNMGIAVGLSASLVPYNLKEVCAAICSRVNKDTLDPLSYIKGPDFPTGGKVINAENLPEIYRTGRGTIKVQSHYRLEQHNGKTEIIFTDLPYGVETESGVIAPLKKFILEEGNDYFDNYLDETSDYNKIAIRITLAKGADVNKALAILFDKTKLESTISINNTVLVEGEPKCLGLLDLIDRYIAFRSGIIQRIAQKEAAATQHKLTVAIGLQKCTSNIDKLVSLIRSADNKSAAKKNIMDFFALNDEQADAILDMKLSRLSRLDVQDIADSVTKYNNELVKENDVINNPITRNAIICAQLKDVSDKYGDERRTEICLSQVAPQVVASAIARPMFVYPDGLKDSANPNAIGVVIAKTAGDYFGYDAEANLYTFDKMQNCIGASKITNGSFFITISKNGLIKCSSRSEYENMRGKACRLKDGDSLLFCGFGDGDQYALVLGENNMVMKTPLVDLTMTGRTSQGSSLGVGPVKFAAIVGDENVVMMMDKDNKAKLTSVGDFSENSRTSKGQEVMPDIKYMVCGDGRDTFYGFTNTDKIIEIPASKLSVKGKTAGGATTTARVLKKVI